MSNISQGFQVLTLQLGQQVKLSGSLFYTDGSKQADVYTPLIWNTSNPAVAQLKGIEGYCRTAIILTSVSVGTCNVSVTDGTFTQTLQVTVVATTKPTPLGIIIDAGDQANLATQPTTQLPP